VDAMGLSKEYYRMRMRKIKTVLDTTEILPQKIKNLPIHENLPL
jgi:hypothetical protein